MIHESSFGNLFSLNIAIVAMGFQAGRVLIRVENLISCGKLRAVARNTSSIEAPDWMSSEIGGKEQIHTENLYFGTVLLNNQSS